MTFIILSSDHAGKILLDHVSSWLQKKGIEYRNIGPSSIEPVNWAKFGAKAAKIVSENPTKYKAILICGSGIGMSIVANRFPNVRAALCRDQIDAELSRKHNDSNILCLGARFLSEPEAFLIIEKWLQTDFDGGRHSQRLLYIEKCLDREIKALYEKKN